MDEHELFIYKNDFSLLLALSIKGSIFTRNVLIHKAFGLKRLTHGIPWLSTPAGMMNPHTRVWGTETTVSPYSEILVP
jgi:hypothetical protein